MNTTVIKDKNEKQILVFYLEDYDNYIKGLRRGFEASLLTSKNLHVIICVHF